MEELSAISRQLSAINSQLLVEWMSTTQFIQDLIQNLPISRTSALTDPESSSG